MSIKECLLKTDNFVDNIYLDKYCDLIRLNKSTGRINFKTQRHHIVPKFVFKCLNIPVDNSKTNLVNLLYVDHCLAHYYLALCSKTLEAKHYNFISIRHILGSKSLNIEMSEKEFIEHLPYYQELYENTGTH